MLLKKIDCASSGANAIIAAVTGKWVEVHGYCIVAAGAVTAKWVSGSTDLTGAMTLATGTPQIAMPGNSLDTPSILRCAAGEALNLTLGGAVQVSGWIVYSLHNTAG